jgi:hypothetical protein
MVAVYCHYRDRRDVILLYRGEREKQKNRFHIYCGANIVCSAVQCSAVKNGKGREEKRKVLEWDRQIWKLANGGIAHSAEVHI